MRPTYLLIYILAQLLASVSLPQQAIIPCYNPTPAPGVSGGRALTALRQLASQPFFTAQEAAQPAYYTQEAAQPSYHTQKGVQLEPGDQETATSTHGVIEMEVPMVSTPHPYPSCSHHGLVTSIILSPYLLLPPYS